MRRLCINERSLAEARDVLMLFARGATDDKKELLAPVIELLSLRREAPGARQVTFFLTSPTTDR